MRSIPFIGLLCTTFAVNFGPSVEPEGIHFGDDELPEVGQPVWYFHGEKRSLRSHVAYLAIEDHQHGIFRPRIGMSEGWVPGVVSDVEANYTRIRTVWPHWVKANGQFCCNQEADYEVNMYRNLSTSIRTRALRKRYSTIENRLDAGYQGMPHEYPNPREVSASQFPLIERSFVRQEYGYRPELSLIVFRWGGRMLPATKHSELLSTNPNYLYTLADLGLKHLLELDYEIWTVYISNSEDCENLAKTFHLVFSETHPARRARHTASMWFVHPTSFDITSQPVYETGEAHGSGYIEHGPFFGLMRAVERAGVFTGFPHNAHLYELLAGKSWTHMLAMDTALKIPATIAVPRVFVNRGPVHAGEYAMQNLQDLKIYQMQRYNKRWCGYQAVEMDQVCPDEQHATYPDDVFLTKNLTMGVAKLGYSWEALDVKLWNNLGQYPIEDALHDLSTDIEISGERVGQAHYLDHIMVQEYIAHTLELRLFYIENKMHGVWFTKFDKVKANNEFGGFYYMQENVALSYVRGDRMALRIATKKAEEIGEQWLKWLQVQSGDAIVPAIRMDFMVQYTPYGEAKPITQYDAGHEISQPTPFIPTEQLPAVNGTIDVYTLELCEAGFSIFGTEVLKRPMMQALVKSALRH